MASASDLMASAPERSVDGQLFRVADRIVVCRCPVSSSLPIPLGIRAPAGLTLLTWAFAGLEAEGREAGPHGLLVLAAPSPGKFGRLVVETHFHAIAVTLADEPPSRLPAADRAILCQAVLAAMAPANSGSLAPLLDWLAPEMRALPLADDAPRLALLSEREAALTGYAVPDYVVLMAGERHACRRVERARLRVGAETVADLTLAPAAGGLEAPPDRALLIGGDRVLRARLRDGPGAR